MTEDRLESDLQTAAREYNLPPEIPRERMWARIDAQRRPHRGRARRSRQLRWFMWPAAAAALLFIGMVIGRSWLPRPPEPTAEPTGPSIADRAGTAASAGDHDRRAVVYAHAATPYFGRIEALLTCYRTGEGDETGFGTRPLSDWAAELLAETRMLMDSPARQDPELRHLLADLELVLARIVQRAGDQGPGRDAWELDNLSQKAVLQRVRNRIPPGRLSSGV